MHRTEPTVDALKHHVAQHGERHTKRLEHLRAMAEAARTDTPAAGPDAPSSPADGETS
jgi:hypothetical protein